MEATSHTHAPVMLGAVEGGVRGGGGAILTQEFPRAHIYMPAGNGNHTHQ